MRTCRIILPAVALAIAVSSLPAPAWPGPSPLDGLWADEFALPRQNGRIETFADYGGQLVMGGTFTEAALTHARHVATWDGSDWHALGDGLDNEVHALLPFGGGLIAATALPAGATTASTVFSWDGSSWSAIGTTDGDVFALVLFGSDLVAGGSFTAINGVAAAGVARWDGSAWHALGSGVGATVLALAVHAGQLVAGGTLPSYNGVAAWDGSTWSQLGAGLQNNPVDATVTGLASDGTSLFAVGKFTQSGTTTCPAVARWDGTAWNATPGPTATVGNSGGIDLWQGEPVACLPRNGPFVPQRWNGTAWVSLGDSVKISALAVHSTGTRLYLGGVSGVLGFTRTNGFFDFDGTTWRPLQRAWAPGMSGIAVSTASDLYDALEWGGKLVVAGGFAEAGAEDHFVHIQHLAAWDGSTWSTFPAGSTGLVAFSTSLLVWQNSLIVGGAFGFAPNASTAQYIARWDGTSWSALSSSKLDNWVWTLGTYGTDLIASGYFYKAGSTVLNGIGRWDGTAWNPLGSGMDQPLQYAYALAEWNGLLVLGADFSRVGGVPAAHIASWNGSTFAELGGGVNDDVYALTTFEGDLVAGGDFTSAGGVAVNAVARWNGTTWTPLGTNAREVDRLNVIGGRLFAVGTFQAPDASIVQAAAVWNGSTWSLLGSGIDGDVRGISTYGGELYVVGNFGWANGHPSFGVARFTALNQLAVDGDRETRRLELRGPSPNPSRGFASLEYSLPSTTPVRLTIHDVTGRLVTTLERSVLPAGSHSATWNGLDGAGAPAPAGLYFVRLDAAGTSRVAKLVRVR